jgi:hypothetical protein
MLLMVVDFVVDMDLQVDADKMTMNVEESKPVVVVPKALSCDV